MSYLTFIRISLPTVVAGAMLLSCGETSVVDNYVNGQSVPVGHGNPVLFAVGQQNTTRAVPLQQAGFQNFGVFGSVDQDVNHPVMHHYLVGYYDEANGYGTKVGSTFGNPANGAGVSYWMYEGMGADEYTGPFAGKPITDQSRSNVAVQKLYYWDATSRTTNFYAYAPYMHGKQTVDFDYAKQRLIYPVGMLTDGYSDDSGMHEYLIASTIVDRSNYGNEVNLLFRRLNCKVAVHFYEDVEGYSAEVLKVEGRPEGEYYKSAGATVSFADSILVTLDSPLPHGADETLRFAAPDTSAIGTTRDLSSPSPTVYYGLPKPVTTGGMTFSVTYRLTSETDGSQITLTDVKAHIPAEKCSWKSNVSYTYIFKIAHRDTSPDDPLISLDDYIKKEEGSYQPDGPRIPICN